MSRREFLLTGGAGAIAAGIASAGVAEAAPPSPTSLAGPGPVPILLRVNGMDRKLSVEPRVTLLDALRDVLDLTGAKKVCDRGTCGACTVHVDGRPVYSCSMLAIESQGKEILTIEGLGTPDRLHPVQAAFVEHDGLQCGFCTPGFVMACAALADGGAMSEARIEQGLGGNLCRCGTYAGIRRAVEEVAKAKGPARG
jgi:aerobic-type carbon monoxide dehydrogenase small subunit (CoxS/CutS family)